jgi:glycosyltransferase involved in cell wall biosynthesis
MHPAVTFGASCQAVLPVADEAELRMTVTGEELRPLYARCRALVMPQEEDFGMTAVEAQASGKAVVALGRGGVLESVPAADPVGGVFYAAAGEAGLEGALREFEGIEGRIEPAKLREGAARFSEGRWAARMGEILGVGEAGRGGAQRRLGE